MRWVESPINTLLEVLLVLGICMVPVVLILGTTAIVLRGRDKK